MKLWEAAFLSPLNAVRLIVALTNSNGDQLAELITDLSPRGRRHLHNMDVVALAEKFGVEACNAGKIPADYETDHSRALAAIRPAQKLLEGWAREGKLAAWGDVAEERLRIGPHEWVGREIDYVTGALVGSKFAAIRFERADIERLCAGRPSTTQPLAEVKPTAADNPRRRAAKETAVVLACKANWPKGIPSQLPAAERDKKIRDWCAKNNGPRAVSDRQIQRALKQFSEATKSDK